MTKFFRQNHIILNFLIVLLIAGLGVWFLANNKESSSKKSIVSVPKVEQSHWFILHRKSNIEFLYKGIPGDKSKSELIKTFNVKTGIPGERPTPLPQLLSREYWILTKKEETLDPETAPYFLTLDVPTSDQWPYGPVPYLECNGQCDWVTIGYFGLHGVNRNPQKLSKEDPGSSGCIRHSDKDITYLYNLLEPEITEIRYYIEDK